MRIMGIDPGIERVGIAIIEKEKGKEKYLFSECFKTSAKLPHSDRLALIGEKISSIIKIWKPKSLSIEKLFFETNVKTAISVAEGRGVIMYEAAKNKLDIFEFTPLEIKVAVTGYGKSDKYAVMRMVPLLVKLPEDKKILDDEMDAIAVALTAFCSKKF